MMIRSISLFTELLVLSAMAVFLPLAPVGSTLLSGHWRHMHRYGYTVKVCTRMIGALWKSHVVARNLERVLRIDQLQPERVEGNCTHCGRCCVNQTCVFLQWDNDTSGQAPRSRCSIYNNWFWKLTTCGSYPLDAHSIEVYDCPSFKAAPLQVVPITLYRTRPSRARERR
jgi:hypothetical protein